jgi:hypothetical protein
VLHFLADPNCNSVLRLTTAPLVFRLPFVVLEEAVEGLHEGLAETEDPDLGRIILAKNAAARASASGSGGRGLSFHALPCGVCCTILGALISAAWAGFGRLRGRVVTMVMALMPNAPSASARRRCLRLARLNRCKRDRIDDIVHHRTARQVVHRFAQPL